MGLVMDKAKGFQLFTGVAGGGGTGGAGVRRGFDAAASSTYAEGGDEFLEVFVPTNRARYIFFSSHRDEGFKWFSATLTKKFINGHDYLIISFFCLLEK
jgi:hypothetical protein